VPEYKDRIDCIRRYHQQTKHRFDRYANGPQTLDWSMQPNPFRHYEGAGKIELPLTAHESQITYCGLYEAGEIKPRKFGLDSIGVLLELSMGLAAWKEYQGDRWSVRCNPSSGNLHPTEAYVIASGIAGLPAGVYHYVSYDHILEQRCVFPTRDPFVEPFLLIGLSSVIWREAWKYGERAYRYCQLDVGHAVAALRYACGVNGWSAEILSSATDGCVSQLLGLNRLQDYGKAEGEHADLLLKINPFDSGKDYPDMDKLTTVSGQGQWFGRANILDKHHFYQWPVTEEVAIAAVREQALSASAWIPEDIPDPLPCTTELLAGEIILRRRSAQMYDGQTGMEVKEFYRILDMTLPRSHIPPWDTMPGVPRIHPVLFVHRVNGLEPGLYILLRNAQALENLKNAMIDTLEWSTVQGAPRHLRLYRLVKANARNAAASLSCHQRIAADGAFSLGMLSEFDAAMQTGPWAYKHLYWEAGMLGQVLYLEAEAIDLQGTGIGCFFDDPFHEMLGIKDSQFQSLYHFTVGGALNDGRLRTLMPYDHLRRT